MDFDLNVYEKEKKIKYNFFSLNICYMLYMLYMR